jgi:hypothetical protein
MLPEFNVRVLVILEFGETNEGRAVLLDGENGTAGEIYSDAYDLLGNDIRLAAERGDEVFKHREIIARVLESPVDGEHLSARRENAVNDGVGVVHHHAAAFLAVFYVNEHSPARKRSEIYSDRIFSHF